MSKNNKIGIFDSGVGGLTLVKYLMNYLPGYDIIYFGDTARVPYGNKSKDRINKFSLDNTNFLIEKGSAIVIMGCNTASSVAYDTIKNKYKFPILDIIFPGVKEALRLSTSGVIGVIGTKATINSNTHKNYLHRLDPSVRVYSNSCPLLVPLAENNNMSDNVVNSILEEYLEPLVEKGIDTLILGCTHYPHFIESIQKLYPRLNLVDPADQAAKDLKKLLSRDKNLDDKLSKDDKVEYFVSDELQNFSDTCSRFTGKEIDINKELKLVDIDEFSFTH